MSPKISFHLAVLLGAVLLQSGEGTRYRDFANSHIEPLGPRNEKLSAYCYRMMRERGLSRRTCKPSNAFIHSSANSIQLICRGAGTRVHPWRNMYDSRQSFRVTTCHSRGRFPRCHYQGEQRNGRVRVGCRNGAPVQFYRLR
ncbi:ribonuclease-like [Sphaerodactylus townsendi]|uniref:ribonuclease-like n=1 Tax=Sphaerodactylus townsendi TaxID=933632 RepID=UPI00202637B7|nr:ribonuclease-like [Sphaerodactylus townsendi]